MKYIFRPLKELEVKHLDVLSSLDYYQTNENARDYHYLLVYVVDDYLESSHIISFPHVLTDCRKGSILGKAKRNDYTSINIIEEFLIHLLISNEAATHYLRNL